jgi:signal transduction histidine kinase/CheY-like chemotaxis protein
MNILSITKRIAGRLLRMGTDDLQDQEMVKRITIVNTLCITFSVVLIVMICILAIPGGWEKGLLIPLFIELLLNNLVLVASYYRQYSLAAIWLFLLQCGATMYFGNLLGSEAQLQFAIIYQIALVYLVFPTRLERRFCIACTFVALIFLELNYYYQVPGLISMNPQTGLLVHSVVILAVLCVVLVACRPFVQNNDLHTAFVKADHYKKVYLYQVTHDLKTPLHVMTVAASLIKQELRKQHPPRKVEELLEQLQAAGISANTLVNNVLTMAEIEAGKMETPESGSFIVRDFFTNIVHVHKVIAGTRNIKLKLSIDQTLPEFIISDSLKLNQVTTNILSNAIRYAYRNSTVEMEVFEQDEQLVIRIGNQGQGIAPELLQHLFNPFVTGSSRHRSGTGLGLYIVKTKVNSMGGHISVNSEAGGLTSFTVMLPLQPGVVEEEIKTLDCHIPPAHHAHVLLAGPLQQPHGLQSLPETMGCRVSRASDDNEVLAIVSNDLPDVIIMDGQLPGFNVMELLKRLKRNALLKAIPVLVTSVPDKSCKQNNLLEAGADGIIGNQFNYRQLYKLLSPFVRAT